MYNEIQTEPAADGWSPIEAEEIADGIVDDADLEVLEELEILEDMEMLSLLDEDGVDEIVDSLLDAADVEILEDLGGGPVGADSFEGRLARAEAASAVLVRRLMADFLRRYGERKRREAAQTSATPGEGGAA